VAAIDLEAVSVRLRIADGISRADLLGGTISGVLLSVGVISYEDERYQWDDEIVRGSDRPQASVED
jgi:hypothetical protein